MYTNIQNFLHLSVLKYDTIVWTPHKLPRTKPYQQQLFNIWIFVGSCPSYEQAQIYFERKFVKNTFSNCWPISFQVRLKKTFWPNRSSKDSRAVGAWVRNSSFQYKWGRGMVLQREENSKADVPKLLYLVGQIVCSSRLLRKFHHINN